MAYLSAFRNRRGCRRLVLLPGLHLAFRCYHLSFASCARGCASTTSAPFASHIHGSMPTRPRGCLSQKRRHGEEVPPPPIMNVSVFEAFGASPPPPRSLCPTIT